MTPVVATLILTAALLHATWNAILRSGSDRLWSITVMGTVGVLVALPVAIGLPHPAPPSWPYIALSAFLQTGYSLFLVRAYRDSHLTHVYPIARGTAPLLVTLGAAVFAGEQPAVRLFVNDPAVVPLAAAALRVMSCGNIGYAYAMVMLQAFNGAGDTLTPTIVNFFGFWVLELPLAWWLAESTPLHARGAFLSIVVAEGSIALASMVLFRCGRWKVQRI